MNTKTTIRRVFAWLRTFHPTPKPTAPRPYYINGVLVRPVAEDDPPAPRVERDPWRPRAR